MAFTHRNGNDEPSVRGSTIAPSSVDMISTNEQKVTLVRNEVGDLVPSGMLDPRIEHHKDLMLQMQLQRFYKQYGGT